MKIRRNHKQDINLMKNIFWREDFGRRKIKNKINARNFGKGNIEIN